MSLMTAGLMSNVAIFASELASLTAVTAAAAMSGFSVMTASKDLSACSLDLISVCVVAMSAVPLTCWLVTSPPKPFLTPSQRCCRPMLFCSWMTQSTFLTPAALSFAPAASPAIALGLPDVGDRAELLELLGAGVQRDDRDAGRLRLGQRALDGVRVGHGDRQAVDLLRDRGVDQLGLLLRVVVGRAPDELDALVLGRLLGALLDDRPEPALVAMGHHREGQAASLGQGDAVRALRGRAACCCRTRHRRRRRRRRVPAAG